MRSAFQIVDSRSPGEVPQLNGKRFAVLALGLAAAWLAGCLSARQASLAATRIEAQKAVSRGDCASALPFLDDVLRQDPQDLSSRRSRASCYMQEGIIGRSISELEVVARQDPTTDSFLRLADGNWKAGRVQAAWVASRKASEVSERADLLLHVAGVQVAYDDLEGAENSLNKVRDANRDWRWFMTMGVVLSRLGPDEAYEAMFTKSLTLAGPDSASVLLQLADARERNVRCREAVVAWGEVRSSFPAAIDARASQRMGNCQMQISDFSGAVISFRASVSLSSDIGERESIRIDLVRALIKAGITAEAKAVLNEVLSNPNAGHYNHTLARNMLDLLER